MLLGRRGNGGVGLGTLKVIFWSIIILAGVTAWRAGLLT
jgi:hypothetical protein